MKKRLKRSKKRNKKRPRKSKKRNLRSKRTSKRRSKTIRWMISHLRILVPINKSQILIPSWLAKMKTQRKPKL